MSNYKSTVERRYYHLRKYKLSKGCSDCGYNKDAIALCFSHINPGTKSAELTFAGSDGRKVRGGIAPLIRKVYLKDKKKNTERIKILFDELRKCKIQCQNCHAIETRNNGEYNWHKNHSKRNKVISPVATTLNEFLV